MNADIDSLMSEVTRLVARINARIAQGGTECAVGEDVLLLLHQINFVAAEAMLITPCEDLSQMIASVWSFSERTRTKLAVMKTVG
jgi:hypothetical protein